MGKLILFIKKYDSYLTIGFILVIVIGVVVRGKIYSQRINENSELGYGFIYKEGKQMTYYFHVDGQRFEGNINKGNGRNNVGDTLIIQYNIKNPTFHIVHSKKVHGKDFNDVSLKRVSPWKIR